MPAARDPQPTYRGHRLEDGATVVTVDGAPFWGRFSDIFDWGPASRGTSGDLALAIALLVETVGDYQRAIRLHRGFREDVIVRLRDAWELPGRVIEDWLASRGEAVAA